METTMRNRIGDAAFFMLVQVAGDVQDDEQFADVASLAAHLREDVDVTLTEEDAHEIALTAWQLAESSLDSELRATFRAECGWGE